MTDSGDQSDGLMKRKQGRVRGCDGSTVMFAAHFLTLEISKSWMVSWLFCVSWSLIRWPLSWDICKLQEFDRRVPRSAGVEGEKQWTETASLWNTSADRLGLPGITCSPLSVRAVILIEWYYQGQLMGQRRGISFVTGWLPAQILWCVPLSKAPYPTANQAQKKTITNWCLCKSNIFI